MESGTNPDDRDQREVVTHRASETYVPFFWEDITSDFPDLGSVSHDAIHACRHNAIVTCTSRAPTMHEYSSARRSCAAR